MIDGDRNRLWRLFALVFAVAGFPVLEFTASDSPGVAAPLYTGLAVAVLAAERIPVKPAGRIPTIRLRGRVFLIHADPWIGALLESFAGAAALIAAAQWLRSSPADTLHLVIGAVIGLTGAIFVLRALFTKVLRLRSQEDADDRREGVDPYDDDRGD